MDLAHLATRLKRDLLRSPKKAAILGILVLVALWFWAPLLAKWVGKGQASKPKEPPVTVAMPPVAGTSGSLAQAGSRTTADATAKPKLLSWTELLSAIERDGRMRPAALDDAFVSPFVRDDPEPDEAETTAKEGTTKPQDAHPSRFGLVLTSTLVGSAARLATITGETYRQDDIIVVALDGADEGIEGAGGVSEADEGAITSRPHATVRAIEFRVEKIQPNYVILTHQAKSYRLDLQRRGLAGRARPIRKPARQVN